MRETWWCEEHHRVGNRNACGSRVKVERCPMVEPTADHFWQALDHQQEWLTEPQVMYDEDELIWKMTAKEGFIFDDSFWEVFALFPFKICHVSYSGASWSQEGGPPEMVLRFALTRSLGGATVNATRTP